MRITPLFQLLRLEFVSDFRGGKIFWSNLIYISILSYVAYVGFTYLDTGKAIALIWIFVVFSAIQFVSDNYSSLNKNRMYYLRNTVSPFYFTISKLLYNCFFSFLHSLLIALLLTFFFNISSINILSFSGVLFLGTITFVSIFSTTTFIGAKAKHRNTLNTLLGLPLIIPQLMISIKLSEHVIFSSSSNEVFGYTISLIALFLLSLCFALVINIYLWHD